MRHILFYPYRCLLLFACCLAVCGCDKKPKTYSSDVSAYNYTSNSIERFSVTNLDDGTSSGGPDVDPKKEGATCEAAGSVCCISGIPDEWRPGLWVKVVWLRDQHPFDHGDRTGLKWFQATAEIPPYKGAAGFFVKFLSGDRIRLHVGSNDPRPDGTYERSYTQPAEDDPYIVQGILDANRNAKQVKILVGRIQRDLERQEARMREQQESEAQKEGEKP